MTHRVNHHTTYYIYILNCDNGSYYTGYTTDLTRRFAEHLAGTDKCKYTRSFKALSIAQSWQISGSLSIAMKIEKFIKQLSKQKKQELVIHPDSLSSWLANCSLFSDSTIF